MIDNESLLDEVGDVIGGVLFGMAIYAVLWVLFWIYVFFAVISLAIITEIIWPLLRWLLTQAGILLLRGYNRASRIVLGLDHKKG